MARIDPRYVGGTLDDLKQELQKVPGFRLQQRLYDFSVTLAQCMTTMRRVAGLTQTQLGEKVGVSQPLIARLETDQPERMPTFATVGRIADACDYDMEVILRPRNRGNEILLLNIKDYLR